VHPVPFDVVVVVASAGGVFAVPSVVARLPSMFAAAVLLAQHRHPQGDYVAPILSRRTDLAVAVASAGASLSPGTLSVAPATPQLGLDSSRRFRLTEARRCAFDPLMADVAEAYGERAIAVVLTGGMRDGVAGALAINAHGGRVIVQDPATATSPALPAAVVATGCADFVLPLEAIADALVSLAMVPGASELFRTNARGIEAVA
jgi:two-component system chemotaxis response regulator CheB